MSVRLFHRGARLVLVLRSANLKPPLSDPSCARWLAVHRAPHRWDRILTKALQILDLPAHPPPAASMERWAGELRFGEGFGEVRWTAGRYWTTIDVCLRRGSPPKRQLVAAALLKAARYQIL